MRSVSSAVDSQLGRLRQTPQQNNTRSTYRPDGISPMQSPLRIEVSSGCAYAHEGGGASEPKLASPCTNDRLYAIMLIPLTCVYILPCSNLQHSLRVIAVYPVSVQLTSQTWKCPHTLHSLTSRPVPLWFCIIIAEVVLILLHGLLKP